MTPSVVSLPPRALARARRKLSREHPAFRGARSEVTAKPNGTYSVVLRATTRLPDGATLKQVLRATVNEQGELLRVVVSK